VEGVGVNVKEELMQQNKSVAIGDVIFILRAKQETSCF
jgi:hypothetical protein